MSPQNLNGRITFLNTLFLNKKVLLEFTVVFILIFIISYSSFYSLTLLIEKSTRVSNTLDTIAATTTLNLQVLESEVQLHHFFISNNSKHHNEFINVYNQIYKTDLPSLKDHLEKSEDRDVDLEVMSALRVGMDKEFAVFKEVTDLINQKGADKEAINNKLTESEEAKKVVQANFAKLIELEEKELKSQSASASSQARNTINVILSSIVVAGTIVVIGFFVIVFDQMKKRTLERQLILSEEKYRLIFEHVQDVYYKTDLSGKILLISPSVEKYLGVSPEKVIGTNVSLLYVNPADRDKFMDALKVSGSVTDYPLIFKGKDNQLIYAAASSHLVYDENHNPIGVEGMVRDITQQKKINDALKFRTEEAERLNNIAVNRELKMVELKEEIARLKK